MRWLDSVINTMNMILDNLQEIVETVEPGVLWSMVSRRVGHDLPTGQQKILTLKLSQQEYLQPIDYFSFTNFFDKALMSTLLILDLPYECFMSLY